MIVTPGRVAVVLLAAGVASLGIGWQLQSGAAGSLELAGAVQQRDVPESDSAPPSVDENRAILDSLGESIELRREIDSLLGRVEEIVGALRDRRDAALSTATLVGSELSRIAALMGGAVDASRAASERLDVLDGRLRTSSELAAQIAEELEELDRSIGPSLVLPR